MSSSSDAEDTHPIPQSAFLRLPGEVRNQIYCHVLTIDSGILDYSSSNSNGRVINKIQYVCQQLRTETAWLELKVNPLIKLNGAFQQGVSATERFLAFLGKVPPEKHCWLQTVQLSNDARPLNIYDELVECQKSLLLLTPACEKNPQIHFEYHLAPFYDYKGIDRLEAEYPVMLMFCGIVMSRIIRQQVHDPTLFPYSEIRTLFDEQVAKCMEEDCAKQLKDSSPVVKELRKRIRFFPVQDLLQPDPFRGRAVHGTLASFAQVQGRFPAWEATIKGWMQEGF